MGSGMFDLERFVEAQNKDKMYEQALAEIRAGSKETHWIWYVLPQLKILARSSMDRTYGLSGLAEAKVYMQHPVLRERLLEICQAFYELEENDPMRVLGDVDAYKMRSCCTLFRAAAPECEVFDAIIEKYCMGMPCEETLEFLGNEV